MARTGPASVSLLVLDGEGRVLLVRRGDGGLFPRTWTLPGGELGRGEDALTSGRRILHDTLSLDLVRGDYLATQGQPGHLRDERGPDTVLSAEVAGVLRVQPPWTDGAFVEAGAMNDLRMFREAREYIGELVENAKRLAPA